jgi:cobyrinic acid a,c-diamide synthase
MSSPRSPKPAKLVIAAPQGRSGKTTVTLGICAALARRGLAVQPFKKGPDYIDPSWLSEAARQPCRSLDPFFAGTPENLIRAFEKGARGAAISVIEGNHGLFDSTLPAPRQPGEDCSGEDRQAAFGDRGEGSTAAVARLLGAPVLLVVNAARMGRSAAAIVHGCQTFEPGVNIAGVVLNNVANSRHETRLREAVEGFCKIPVVGAIPRDENLAIPDRHLGLIPRTEGTGLLPALETCRKVVEDSLDLDLLLEIAGAESTLPGSEKVEPDAEPPHASQRPPHNASQTIIGVIRDRAFSFYYPENLEALEEAGAQLKTIDALQDPHIPAVDALVIGGGFPEMFLDELERNITLRAEIRQAVEDGMPVYAECGGLMYLSKRITWNGRSAEMVGALPFEVEMTPRPQGHGYVLGRVSTGNPFIPEGVQVRGHEFHHSRVRRTDLAFETAYHLDYGKGLGDCRDGIVYRNLLASYTHLHVQGAPGWAETLAGKRSPGERGNAGHGDTGFHTAAEDRSTGEEAC